MFTWALLILHHWLTVYSFQKVIGNNSLLKLFTWWWWLPMQQLHFQKKRVILFKFTCWTGKVNDRKPWLSPDMGVNLGQSPLVCCLDESMLHFSSLKLYSNVFSRDLCTVSRLRRTENDICLITVEAEEKAEIRSLSPWLL